MKDLRVGVLGTGGIAQAHAKALMKLPNVRFVGLCNRSIEKAEKFNASFGGTAKCFSDFDQMLKSVEMDALYVCLPPGSHCGQTEAAAARGIHLFLEKPICLDLARGESIAKAVRSAGVKCQIGHHFRHADPVRKLKQMILDGSAGKPLFMQGRWYCNALHPDWWQNPAIGGGQLIEQAIHIYDLARHFMGDADIVTAFAANLAHARFPQYQVDDTSASTIRFRSGAIASICASNFAEPTKWAGQCSILCEKVMVELQAPEKATFIYHGGHVSEEVWRDKLEIRREEVVNQTNPYDEISRNFVAAIREGEPLRSSIEDGIQGLKLVLGAAASAKQNGAPQRL